MSICIDLPFVRKHTAASSLKDEIEILKDSSITVVSGGRNPIRDYVKAILDQAQFVNIFHVAKILLIPLPHNLLKAVARERHFVRAFTRRYQEMCFALVPFLVEPLTTKWKAV